MPLAAVAWEASRGEVAGDGHAAPSLGQDVVEALGRITAVGAAVPPSLEDAGSEAVARDEFRAINPGLHPQSAAGAMLSRAASVTNCYRLGHWGPGRPILVSPRGSDPPTTPEPDMATINSVTLVGRNSAVEVIEFPSGAVRARFEITIQRGDMRHVIPCEAWGKLADEAGLLDEGQLIGLIGSLTRDKLIRLDRLERLGPARV